MISPTPSCWPTLATTWTVQLPQAQPTLSLGACLLTAALPSSSPTPCLGRLCCCREATAPSRPRYSPARVDVHLQQACAQKAFGFRLCGFVRVAKSSINPPSFTHHPTDPVAPYWPSYWSSTRYCQCGWYSCCKHDACIGSSAVAPPLAVASQVRQSLPSSSHGCSS